MNRTTAGLFGALIITFSIVICSGFLNSKILNTSLPLEEETNFCIIVDAGHGGEDGGTSSADGTLEKDINLSVARKLATILRASGYSVVMTREDNEQIGDLSLPTIRQRKISDIKKRLAFTEKYPNSILVSIHQNHYSSPKYSGTQVFYSPNNPQSLLLAECVRQSFVNSLQKDNTRETKKVGTNIYLLYNSKIPSIMVECGFLSNTEETQKLKNDDYQRKIAFTIMCGIQKFLEENDG